MKKILIVGTLMAMLVGCADPEIEIPKSSKYIKYYSTARAEVASMPEYQNRRGNLMKSICVEDDAMFITLDPKTLGVLDVNQIGNKCVTYDINETDLLNSIAPAISKELEPEEHKDDQPAASEPKPMTETVDV